MTKNKSKQPKIIPRGPWVLVKPIQKESVNDYGIAIPDSVEKEQKAQGVIVSVGPKVEDLKVGQTVLYGMYAGEDIQLSNKEEERDKVDFKLLLDEDILAVIEL